MKRKIARLTCLALAIFSAIRLMPVLSTGIVFLRHQIAMASDPALTGGGFAILPIGGTPLWVPILGYAILLTAAIVGIILLRPRRKEKHHDQT